MLLFSIIIFVTLYHNLAFVHRNAISISNPAPNPPAPSSVFVKELSVNDNNMSKNNNANIRTAHPLPQATIKTHALALKTTSQKQLASKSNISNQRVSLPIGYNHNINNYTHALTKSPIQNTNNFSLSQQSSIGKSLSNGNSRTREELASVPISSSNNNNTSNIQINSHLAVVPHHVVIPTKTTIATSKNNTGIVHKTIASTQIPNFNDDSTKIYYESSTVKTKKSQLRQQQQEQKLKSTTQPNLDSLPLITANAGPDQKIKEGKKVTLHGAGIDSNTDQLNFLWNQISGKSVKLHHTDTAKAKFKAPHVKKTTKLGFQLAVYDSSGNSSSDTVNIIVKSHKHSHNHKHRQ